MLTGEDPLYLRAEITGGRGDVSEATRHQLWSPAAKLVASRISDYLFEDNAGREAAGFERDELPLVEAAMSVGRGKSR
jgi:hypothetical protein